MNQDVPQTAISLDQARALVAALEGGNTARGNELLDDMTRLRECDLFREVGKLTRTLHDTLNSFQHDSRLSALAEVDIPDARERLRYVVKKTEQAAHRTLKAVEQGLPLAKRLEDRARSHKQDWDKFLRREMQPEEFRALAKTLPEFLGSVISDTSALNQHLAEVMVAQDYQDLTGQVIDRVIGIVQEMESSLVDLIRLAGTRMQPGEKKNGHDGLSLEGPQINAPARSDVVANQDEVDQLLASLGF
jgi:chemotaxis protein CheZ